MPSGFVLTCILSRRIYLRRISLFVLWFFTIIIVHVHAILYACLLLIFIRSATSLWTLISVCCLVGRLVSWSDGRSVCHDSLQGLEAALQALIPEQLLTYSFGPKDCVCGSAYEDILSVLLISKKVMHQIRIFCLNIYAHTYTSYY